MIQLESIEIEEFRGIRKMQLSLNKKNFGICGPNGTGKSGVVDAIEFALTGDITRLSGLGSAELSVKAHGPHVDSRKTPDKSWVKITAYAPSLGHDVSIQRSVAAPSAPVITPNDAKTKALVSKLGTHPEFALSRREIVKYILTPAGQRSKDVQTLLRLDQIETVRQSLVKIANDAKKQAGFAVTEDERAKKEFLQHLGITSLSKAELLAVVNAQRQVLQLDSIEDLKPGVSLKDGVVVEEGKTSAKSRIVKVTALNDLEAFRTSITEAVEGPVAEGRDAARTILKALQADATSLGHFKKRLLVEQGLALMEDDACPLCDNPWDAADLEKHLKDKLAAAETAGKQLEKLQGALQPIVANAGNIIRSAKKLVEHCGLLEPKIEGKDIKDFANAGWSSQQTLSKVSEDPSQIEKAIGALEDGSWKMSKALSSSLAEVEKALKALPEASDQDKAIGFLSAAQVHYDRCKTTKSDRDAADGRSVLAASVSKVYNETSTKVLEDVYSAVEKDFTDYYRVINSDDEESFEGKLTPSPAKLAFDVDFYGRGKSAPGAYHSEGHQDGMGLCLYLALMRHTLGDQFIFAVLDDVLMSVDTGHRREVCTLLRTKFPKTQFVLTTHDPIWLQFMRTQNLVQSSVSFGGWTVDTGPQIWKEGDVWEQIKEKLDKNDIPGAAATMRRYLEYVLRIVADNLRAPVEFHGDGSYDLSDLLPSVLRTWKELGTQAKEACVSWGQDVTQIEAFRKMAKEKVAASQGEQWMINKAVHFNEWANLDKKEFQSAADAFKGLLASMQCAKAPCHSFFVVTPSKGQRQALRCECGDTNFSLLLKE